MCSVYPDIGANCAHENKCMVEQTKDGIHHDEIDAFDEVRPLQRDQGVSDRTLSLAIPRWRKRIMDGEGSNTKTHNDRLSSACITTETCLDVFLFRLGGEFDYILCRFPLWLTYRGPGRWHRVRTHCASARCVNYHSEFTRVTRLCETDDDV